MALSGSFYTDIQTGYRLQIDWSATQDIAGNTSTVTSNLYLVSTSSGYSISSSSSKSADTTIYATTTSTGSVAGLANLAGGQKKSIHGQTTTVSHNSDGTATITLSGVFHFAGLTINGNTWNDKSTSQSITLDTIPRASTLTSYAGWTFGDNLPISISRASTSFTHTLVIEVSDGTNYNTIDTLTGLGTSYTWVPSVAQNTQMFDYANNASGTWNQYTRLTLKTYSGGSLIGTNVYTGVSDSPNATTTTHSGNWNIGDSVSTTFNCANSSFVHTIRYFTNGVLIHTENNVSNGGFNWVPSTSEKTAMYNSVPNSNSTGTIIEIDTYYNGQIVRSTTSKFGTATVTNSNPTLSTIGYLDTNATITALTGNNQYIVQNKSTLRAQVLNANKASAINGASISKYIATVNGVSITQNSPFATDINFDFGGVNSAYNITLSITAYDSRGNTATVTQTINMVAWSPPVVNTSAARTNGFLAETTLTLAGSISPVNVNGTNINSLVAGQTSYQWRIKNGSYNTAIQFNGQTLTMPNYSATNTLVNSPTGLDITSAWEILVTVTDKLGNTQVTLSVGTGTPITFMDDVKKSFGVGMFPTHNNAIESAGQMYKNNGQMVAGYGDYNLFDSMNGGVPYEIIDFNNLTTVGEFKFINLGGTGMGNTPTTNGNGYYFGMGGGDTGNRGFQLLGTTASELFFREMSNKTWHRTWNDGNDQTLMKEVQDLGSAADWSTMTEMGTYRVFDSGAMHANNPQGAYTYGNLMVITRGVGVTQIYYTHGSVSYQWSRTKWNASDWTAWNISLLYRSGTSRANQYATTRMNAVVNHGCPFTPSNIQGSLKWSSGAVSLDIIDAGVYFENITATQFTVSITNKGGQTIPAGAWMDVMWIATP